MLPVEAQFLFEGFECIVDNRAVAGPVHELPHAARYGPLSAHQVRKSLADVRARLVDRALVSGQEDATGSRAVAENPPFRGAVGRVIGDKSRWRDTEMLRQPFNIAVGKPHGRDLAAIGARAAVDLLLDVLCDPPQALVRVGFDRLAKA